MSEMMNQAEELRAAAIRELARSPAWAIAKAADDMVEALGGKRILPALNGIFVKIHGGGVIRTARSPTSGGRLSQGDAAEQVLLSQGGPLPVNQLLAQIESLGVVVGGERKEINLSSALSRDDRFDSIRVAGQPLWTLKSIGLGNLVPPPDEDDDL